MITNTIGDNILTTIIDYIDDNTGYMAIGTDTTTPTADDTALGAEVVRNTRQESSVYNNTITVSGYFTSTQANGSDLSEVGVFNAASVGTMTSRDTFVPFTKSNYIEVWVDIEYTIDITLNESEE